MLWKAGYGHCRSRWHYASRVIISLGGRGDNRVQVCDGLAPAQSCTPLFLYKCVSLAARANGAEGVRESVADLFGHSLTAKGGNRGCWSGCLGGGSAGDQTDRRASTFSLIYVGIGRTLDQGTIGPYIPIGLHPFPDAYTHLSTLSTGGRSGHGGQWWTAVGRICPSARKWLNSRLICLD